MPAVTQVQFIAHQQSIIDSCRKKISEGFQTLDHYQMKELTEAVTYRQKLVGFARSGKLKEFFI